MSFLDDLTGSSYISKAQEASQRGYEQSYITYWDMFDVGQDALGPYNQGGNWALERLIGTSGMTRDIQTQNYNDPGIFKMLDAYKTFNRNVLPKDRLYRDADEHLRKYRSEYQKFLPEGMKTSDIPNWRTWVNDPYPVDRSGNRIDLDLWSAAKQAVESGQSTFKNPRQPVYMGEPVEGILSAGGGLPEMNWADFRENPYYKLQLEEGIKALESSAAGRGMLQSGQLGKSLLNFAGDNAYEHAMDVRRQQVDEFINTQLNPLLSILGVGQVSANQMANNALQSGQLMGNAQQQAGEARASGYLGQMSAAQNALGMGMDIAGLALSPFSGGASLGLGGLGNMFSKSGNALSPGTTAPRIGNSVGGGAANDYGLSSFRFW